MNGYKKEDILVGVFILAFICAVIFCCTSRNNVYDNGYGTNKVRTELENAQATQREETRTIEDTEKSINRGKERVDESTRTNKEITSVERADAEIIDECEQILAKVRERGGAEN